MKKNYDISLKEAARALEEQYKSVDGIKQTIRTVFSSSSIVISLTSGVQLFSGSVDANWSGLYIAGIVTAAVLYLTLIVFCILGMWPINFYTPVKMEWNILTSAFSGKDEAEISLKHLSAILNAINLNDPKLKKLLKIELVALIIMPLLVTLLLLLAFIPRI